jgi:hypothetical protein
MSLIAGGRASATPEFPSFWNIFILCFEFVGCYSVVILGVISYFIFAVEGYPCKIVRVISCV